MATSHEIYGFIGACCRPAKLPGSWHRFGAHRSPPVDWGALPADRRKEFPTDDLINSRVVVPAANDFPLHHGLTDVESIVIALRPRPSELPIDLVFGAGRPWPGFACPFVPPAPRSYPDSMTCLSVRRCRAWLCYAVWGSRRCRPPDLTGWAVAFWTNFARFGLLAWFPSTGHRPAPAGHPADRPILPARV